MEIALGDGITFRSELRAGGARCGLWRARTDEREWDFDIQVAPAPRIRSTGGYTSTGLFSWRVGLDPLLEAGRRRADALVEGPLPPEFEVGLREVQAHVSGLLDARAVRIAKTFDRMERWSIYELLVEDATGRVAQMASVAPGVLVILSSLRLDDPHRALDPLLALVRGGVPLGRILDAAADAWALACLACTKARGAQRHRIARASACVPRRLLWDAPPFAVIPEDIPTKARENRAWFDLQSALASCTRVLGPRRAEAVAHFVSRHSLALAKSVRTLAIFELVDFILATGRTPSRRTNPVRLLAECERWHAQTTWATGIPPETPLAAEPFVRHGAWRWSESIITPLRTVAELEAESSAMRHCVATRATSAVQGLSSIYHAEILGLHVTIEIAGGAHGIPVLVEARRAGNETLGTTDFSTIMVWLEALRAVHDGRRPTEGRFVSLT